MAKKIFGVYLAKLDAPNSEAHARLELPASPWELHDAMDKVQLQENEELYLEIDDYYGFEYACIPGTAAERGEEAATGAIFRSGFYSRVFSIRRKTI